MREKSTSVFSVDFDVNALRKKVNEVQKEIAAKKKVWSLARFVYEDLERIFAGKAAGR